MSCRHSVDATVPARVAQRAVRLASVAPWIAFALAASTSACGSSQGSGGADNQDAATRPDDAAIGTDTSSPAPDAAGPNPEAGVADTGTGPTEAGPIDSGSVEAAAQPIQVKGVFLDALFAPIVNAKVGLQGASGASITTTDANGAFTLDNVTVPYTVVAVTPNIAVPDGGAAPPQPPNAAVVYEGLTRPDPTLLLFGAVQHSAPSRTQSISGTITGGSAFPLATKEQISMTVSAAGSSLDDFPASATDGTFSTGFNWEGPASEPATIYALESTLDTSGLPLSYTGWGSVAISANDGSAQSALGIAMQTVASDTLVMDTTGPAGTNTQGQWILGLPFGATGVIAAALQSGLTSATNSGVQMLAPKIPGVSPWLLFIAQYANTSNASQIALATRTNLVPGSPNHVAVTLPPLVSISSPAAAATNVTASTSFAWSSVPNSAYGFIFGNTAGGPSPSFAIYTTRTTLQLPDLSAFGLPPLPTNTAYDIITVAAPSTTGVDGIAGPDGISGVGLFSNFFSHLTDGGFSLTQEPVTTSM
jgi:hypothetical protein